MKLSTYNNASFDRGCSFIVESIWIITQSLLINTFIPGTWWRVSLLRLFGAKVGSNCVIKPKLYVKFPWKLIVGDNVWFGERVWIDNLSQVIIHNDVCISQGVYICSGSHDWKSSDFSLIIKDIEIHSSSWIAALSIVGPGVVIENGAVLTLGSVATKRLKSNTIHTGNPAIPIKSRY